MIPQHIIDKAVTAAGENWVITFDWEHDKLYAQVHAALEAAAAEIWDEAVIESCAAACGCLRARLVPNPYDASETA